MSQLFMLLDCHIKFKLSQKLSNSFNDISVKCVMHNTIINNTLNRKTLINQRLC